MSRIGRGRRGPGIPRVIEEILSEATKTSLCLTNWLYWAMQNLGTIVLQEDGAQRDAQIYGLQIHMDQS